MAFYAPRGISPDDIRSMDYADLTVLMAGREKYYDDSVKILGKALLDVINIIAGDENGE